MSLPIKCWVLSTIIWPDGLSLLVLWEKKKRNKEKKEKKKEKDSLLNILTEVLQDSKALLNVFFLTKLFSHRSQFWSSPLARSPPYLRQASGFIQSWSGWRERGGDPVRASLISVSWLAAGSSSRIGAFAVSLLFSQITGNDVWDDQVCDETGYRSYFRTHSGSHLNQNTETCQRYSI